MKSTDKLVPDSPAVFIISRLFGVRKSLDALCFRSKIRGKVIVQGRWNNLHLSSCYMGKSFCDQRLLMLLWIIFCSWKVSPSPWGSYRQPATCWRLWQFRNLLAISWHSSHWKIGSVSTPFQLGLACDHLLGFAGGASGKEHTCQCR